MINYSRRAFTLIELLVVIAIIAILASILFPVFAQAKAAAKKSVDLSEQKQLMLASIQYANDNDDHFMIATYNNTNNNPFNANNLDSIMMMMAYPYFKTEPLMFALMDGAPVSQREYPDSSLTNPNSVPAQWKDYMILFNEGMTADFGINFQYINPEYLTGSGTDAYAVSSTEIVRPAHTIFATSSIWNRDAGGTPYGGGNAGVDAPCVYDQQTGQDTRPGSGSEYGYYWYGGWNPSSPLAWNVFGGVYPWYVDGQQVIISYSDGHAKTVPLTQIAAGCNVEDAWGGYITDESLYQWTSTH